MSKLSTLFLFIMLSFAATAQQPEVLSKYLSRLNNNTVESLVQYINNEGYTEVPNDVFEQKNTRVFKKEDGTPGIWMVEYCGNTLIGYSTTIDNIDNIWLGNNLRDGRYAYSIKQQKQLYKKGDITFVFTFDNSKGVSKKGASHFVSIINTSNCNSKLLAAADFTLQPYTVENLLDNMNLKRQDLVFALAGKGYFEKSRNDAAQVVRYKKDNKEVAAQYCGNDLIGYTGLLNDVFGKMLEEDIKKAGYKMTVEKLGANNTYGRAYDNGQYILEISNLGNDTYDFIFVKKQNPCGK